MERSIHFLKSISLSWFGEMLALIGAGGGVGGFLGEVEDGLTTERSLSLEPERGKSNNPGKRKLLLGFA
jgi:hypothetical protein